MKGYPEISFWITNYFNTQITAANLATFASTKLYVSATATTGNYEFLFSTSSAETRSLYYPGNLEALVSLGNNVGNIVTSPSLVFGTDVILSSQWTDLTT